MAANMQTICVTSGELLFSAEGYRVIRFWNNDVLENIEGVLQPIAATLKA